MKLLKQPKTIPGTTIIPFNSPRINLINTTLKKISIVGVALRFQDEHFLQMVNFTISFATPAKLKMAKKCGFGKVYVQNWKAYPIYGLPW